ncbi:MAG: hypothetical protein ACOYZ8_13380 [Chloroflexota bacterium]
MPTYKIGLARTYLVTIQAENLEDAKRLTGFLCETDLSIPAEREEHKFTIGEIELLENAVFECDNA